MTVRNIRPLSYRGRPLAPVFYELTPGDPRESALEAWTDPGQGIKLSVLPCRVRVERWSDGGWRVMGQRTARRTAEEAAEDYLHDLEGTPARFRVPHSIKHPHVNLET